MFLRLKPSISSLLINLYCIYDSNIGNFKIVAIGAKFFGSGAIGKRNMHRLSFLVRFGGYPTDKLLIHCRTCDGERSLMPLMRQHSIAWIATLSMTDFIATCLIIIQLSGYRWSVPTL